MTRVPGALERVRVAAPCAADWAEMAGDERVRFCARCEQHVYNLSALTKREAERLVMSREDRLCVRFYRRADGTMLTRNCPIGLRALKRRASSLVGAVFAAATTFLIAVGVAGPTSHSKSTPVQAVAEDVTDIFFTEPVCMGACSYGRRLNEAMVGGLLGSVAFLCGYPLLKLKERRDAKQRAALHIWQK